MFLFLFFAFFVFSIFVFCFLFLFFHPPVPTKCEQSFLIAAALGAAVLSILVVQMIASRLLSSVWGKRAVTRLCSSLHKNNTQNSATPLIEKYRNSWPDKPFLQDDIAAPMELPPRTVDAKNLSFEFTARYDFGASIYYPHLNMHPGDFKVVMEVR